MQHLPREALVEQLAALPDEERRRVIREAEARARQPAPSASTKPTLPWASLRAVIGIVHGAPADAVEDSNRLYDG